MVNQRDAVVRPRRTLKAADLVVGLSLAGLLGYSWYLGRGLSFYADDWNVVVQPASQLLIPHFGHLTLVPRVLFRAMTAIFGLHSYAPYRMLGTIGFAIFAVSVYVYMRARMASWFACAVALSLIFFSRSELFAPMFAFMVNYTLPLAAAFWVWALLDRRTWKADCFASAALAFALACSAVGVVAAVAVGAELLFERGPLRRWLTFLPPVVLWVAWYARYHERLGNTGSFTDVLSFTLRELNYTFAAFAGGSIVGGWFLAAFTAVCLTFAIAYRVRRGPAGLGTAQTATRKRTRRPMHGHLVPNLQNSTFTPRAAGALTGAVAFAVATALTRRIILGITQPANVGRYLLVIGVFLMVALVDCYRSAWFGRIAAAVAVVMLVVNGVVMIHALQQQRPVRLDYQATTDPLLAATQALGKHADPNRILPIVIVPIRSADYLAAVSSYGAPPGTTGKPRGNPAGELEADRWMVNDLFIHGQDAAVVPTSCLPLDAAARQILVRPGTRVFLEAHDSIAFAKVRRFASGFQNSAIARLVPQRPQVIAFPTDNSRLPWWLQVSSHNVSGYRCPA